MPMNKENRARNKRGERLRLSSVQKQELTKCLINDMMDGATYSIMIDKLQSDGYGIGVKFYTDAQRSYCYELIKDAKDIIKKDFEDYIIDAREQLWNSVMDLASESREVGDRSTALKAYQYIGKLSGIEDTQKIKIETDEPIQITFN